MKLDSFIYYIYRLNIYIYTSSYSVRYGFHTTTNQFNLTTHNVFKIRILGSYQQFIIIREENMLSPQQGKKYVTIKLHNSKEQIANVLQNSLSICDFNYKHKKCTCRNSCFRKITVTTHIQTFVYIFIVCFAFFSYHLNFYKSFSNCNNC